MIWLAPLAHLFGGVFLTNAVPHLVAGVQGRPFQTPFADPPGRGRSTSIVNVLWGFANLVVAYLLLWHVGPLDMHLWTAVLPPAIGAFAMALFAARHFGRVNGGDLRSDPRA
ncbi:hypothetical protein [Acidimangrovimonas sediminis]|uniref:hypothetical protein n=1 Tax=Acidimangrovimonas sediminis TaxID=2056283 RepID=UPI000C7FC992|nr:hypothetical protein [Acidimangrovimonas sediminis]